MAKSDWLDYQKLAAEIYTELENNAVVTHDEKIRGIESGTDRQIDVSIRTNVAGHDLLIIVQTKDLSRPADVNIVGEFNAVIRDVRAAKGVLICSAGFTKKAIAYGRNLGIDLCTAHDARHRKWAIDLRVPLLWVESTANDVVVELDVRAHRANTEEIRIAPDPSTWLTSLDGGTINTPLGELLAAAWNANAANHLPGRSHRLDLAQPRMRLLMGESYWIPVEVLTCAYTAERKAWLGSLSFSNCRGILNQGTGVMRTKVTLTNADVPLQRDANWKEVPDPQALWASSTVMFRVEMLASRESFHFDRFELTPVDAD